ncbi:hypothetical protein LZC95_19895 [Pendulispora brunnea]|uniref:Uncharacterized protein n=1 Tax=Pendulispora brunnea TaxID=2905690 RepID=A0ABZ2KK71_9BACT
MNASTAREQAAKRPRRCIVLSPAAFADTWSERPSEDVAVGLRLLAERDLQAAKLEASRWVERLYSRDDGTLRDPETATEAWNDALIRWACALAMCDPNDVTRPYFRAAEDTIAIALTPDAIRRVWDALEAFHAEESPVAPEATDDEIEELGWSLLPLEGVVARVLDRARAMGPEATVESIARALQQELQADGRRSFPMPPGRNERRVRRLLARVKELACAG